MREHAVGHRGRVQRVPEHRRRIQDHHARTHDILLLRQALAGRLGHIDVEIEPDDALSHTNLSRLLQQQGKIPEAEEEMDRAPASRLLKIPVTLRGGGTVLGRVVREDGDTLELIVENAGNGNAADWGVWLEPTLKR